MDPLAQTTQEVPPEKPQKPGKPTSIKVFQWFYLIVGILIALLSRNFGAWYSPFVLASPFIVMAALLFMYSRISLIISLMFGVLSLIIAIGSTIYVYTLPCEGLGCFGRFAIPIVTLPLIVLNGLFVLTAIGSLRRL